MTTYLTTLNNKIISCELKENINNIPLLYKKYDDIPVNKWWSQKKQCDIWFSHKEFDENDFYVKWVSYTEETYLDEVQNIKMNWIIWGDQILRHPFKNIDQHILSRHRVLIYDELYKMSKELLTRRHEVSLIQHTEHNHDEDATNLVFTLLVIRHDKHIKSKKFVIDYIKNQITSLLDMACSVPSLYYRFLYTSLKDYMSCLTLEHLKCNCIRIDYNDILEYNPDIILNIDKYVDKIVNTDVYKTFCKVLHGRNDKLTVSLSGGVDSMVLSLCAYIYAVENNIPLDFVHIQYNNRESCDKEVRFLYDWTRRLGKSMENTHLWIRNISEIKRRRETEWRELYEKITREFRFHAYLLVGGTILLGHNYEDTVENIITNITTQTHFDNLKGMKHYSKENNIHICRPFLNISKKEIIQFAHKFNIPYLEDSTPSWSKRGQIRDKIIPTLDNFDKNFIKGLYELSSKITFYKKEWTNTAMEWCDKNITLENYKVMQIKNKKRKQAIQAERILKIKIDDYMLRNNDELWNYIWNKFLNNSEGYPSKKGTTRLINSISSSIKKHQSVSLPLTKDIYVSITMEHVYICVNFDIL